GMGSTWALGLSSAPAQLQANPGSLPPSLLSITGVIPFSETIFLWQSIAIAVALTVVSLIVAFYSTPNRDNVVTADKLGVDLSEPAPKSTAPARPGDRLEHSPLLTILLVLLGAIWIYNEFSTKNAVLA